MYSESFIEELKNSVSISSVIGSKINLKRRGRDYVACCPFHSEKTPSFSVNDDKGIYKCFGCGKGGNVINFIMDYDRVSFKEAIEYIANISGITLPKLEKSKKTKEEITELELIYKINEDSCSFFEKNIFKDSNKISLEYALNRGFNIENIKKYRIGFAEDNFNSLLNYLKNKNYNEKTIEKAGVIAKNDNLKYYDKFRNRLMFPVFDKKGRVIAFSGRILNNDKPKYMNSPETEIFKKSNVLFNYYFAKQSIYEKKYSILVEGNIDTLTLSMNGIENVVAPMGTSITESQILELWNSAPLIYVCLDGDSAGEKAMERLSNKILSIIKIGKNINFVFLPKDLDPDDFVKKYGKLEFEKLLKNSISLSDYLWKKELKNLNIDISKPVIPESKAELENNLYKDSDLIKDKFLKKNFIEFYKNKLWNLNKVNFNFKYELFKTEEIKDKLKYSQIEKNELKILQILCNNPNVIDLIFDKYKINLSSINFKNTDINNVIFLIKKQKNVNEKLVKDELNTYINDIKSNYNFNKIQNDENLILEKLYILLLEKEEILLQSKIDLLKNNTNILYDDNYKKELTNDLSNIKNLINSIKRKNNFI